MARCDGLEHWGGRAQCRIDCLAHDGRCVGGARAAEEEHGMGEAGRARQPLRFGIVRNQTLPWPVLVEQFRRFEALGFDSAWPCDHFQRPSEQEAPYFEGWTL